MKHIERYFERRGIDADHILYAYRNERNLVICMDSGDGAAAEPDGLRRSQVRGSGAGGPERGL